MPDIIIDPHTLYRNNKETLMSNRLPGPLVAIFAAAAIGASSLGLLGLSDAEAAAKTLQAQGWEPIEHKGKDSWACGDGDLYRDKFLAKNPQGKEVEVIVCRGIGKGGTLRTP